jgi:hypothetical protein
MHVCVNIKSLPYFGNKLEFDEKFPYLQILAEPEPWRDLDGQPFSHQPRTPGRMPRVLVLH